MGASLFYICFRYVLPWCLPFLLALLVAALLEPVVLYLRRKFHFQRGFSALILTLTLLFLLGGLLSLLWSTLLSQTNALLAAIEHGDVDTLCANVRNVFEQALDGEQRERIETIKRDLLAYGAKTSAMTGSGSVVFGLFSDKAACRRACEALQGECVKTFCAEFV